MTICLHHPEVRHPQIIRAGSPPQTYLSGRTCADPACRCLLSIYNPGKLCFGCQEALSKRAAASRCDAVAPMTAPLPAPLPATTRSLVLAQLHVGELVTGTDIAWRLGISRAGVGKHVRELRREGHVIEGGRGHGGGYVRRS